MQIQINSDRHIDSSEARDQWARSVVESALGHLADHVSRVEVHFSDENASQGGAPTLSEQKQAAKTARFEAVAQEPMVRAVLDRFPGAEIVAVRDAVAEEIAPAMPENDSES